MSAAPDVGYQVSPEAERWLDRWSEFLRRVTQELIDEGRIALPLVQDDREGTTHERQIRIRSSLEAHHG